MHNAIHALPHFILCNVTAEIYKNMKLLKGEQDADKT